MNKLLEKVRLARHAKKMSQENIAEHLGISQSAYAKIERGDTQLTVVALLSICDYLDIDPHELLYRGRNAAMSNP